MFFYVTDQINFRLVSLTRVKVYRLFLAPFIHRTGTNQGCKSLLSVGGIGGMNLDHDFFQMSKLSEDQKKGLHQKWNTFPKPQGTLKKRSLPEMEHLFSPNSSRDLRSDAHQSQIIGGNADEYHTQIVGGIQSSY